MLKINWNNEARGSWIISFRVLENTSPCTFCFVFIYVVKVEGKED